MQVNPERAGSVASTFQPLALRLAPDSLARVLFTRRSNGQAQGVEATTGTDGAVVGLSFSPTDEASTAGAAQANDGLRCRDATEPAATTGVEADGRGHN